jgi:hypothetical protein
LCVLRACVEGELPRGPDATAGTLVGRHVEGDVLEF